MKSIRDALQKIKQMDRGMLGDLYVVVLILLVGLSSFGLGRMSVLDIGKNPVQIIGVTESLNYVSNTAAVVEVVPKEGTVIDQNNGGTLVASKNGGKYHYPWCSGAQRIKEENKIWFDSADDARKAGYTPAANCKGLK